MATDNQSPQDPYLPKRPIPAKPIVKAYPTPNLRDRIYVERKDSRLGGYKLPNKGDAYAGKDAQKFSGFVFATAVPADQTGWVDHYYLNERDNQDDYNFSIEYPYADKDYPRYIRTYTLLRADFTEPTADALDLVFNGADGKLKLYLVDHKQLRFEDNVLDALFVNVQRVFERLPSPVITSYGQNDPKQIITITEQEVLTADIPVSDALTEVLKVERTTTAKAKVTTGKVDSLFPADAHSIEIPDLLPPEARAKIPNVTESQLVVGDAVLPTLGTGELQKSETQQNEFVKRTSVTKRGPIVFPVTWFDKDLGGLSQGRFGEGFTNILTVQKTIDAGFQTIDTGIFVTDAEVRDLGEGHSFKITKSVTDWPVLRERIIDEKEGIAVLVERRVVPVLNDAFGPAPSGYVDIRPYDKWRSIQITSRVDLTTLPPPLSYATTHHLVIPGTLEKVSANWESDVVYEAAHNNFIKDISNDDYASVVAQSRPRGVILPRITAGYSGITPAILTRRFFSSAPVITDVPTPLIIKPVIGVAYIQAAHVTESGTEGGPNDGPGGVSGTPRQLRSRFERSNIFDAVKIGPCLTGDFVVENQSFASFPISVTATSHDLNGVTHTVTRSVSSSAVMTVEISVSSPAKFVSGQQILVAGDLQRWRFGIFVQELIYARIP